ncbi:MAG: hypothetical protein NVS4B3_16690 [Gemmatimonadaceae bacterium]
MREEPRPSNLLERTRHENNHASARCAEDPAVTATRPAGGSVSVRARRDGHVRRWLHGAGMCRHLRHGAAPLAVLLASAVACTAREHASTFLPADAELREQPLFFYPARDASHRKAFIFLFGNDVAFWDAHQSLAYALSEKGFDVVGLDLKRWLDSLPTDVARRDSAVRAGIVPLVSRSRHALAADALPAILAGHSFGAEFALWMAEQVPPPHLRGVLLMSPRGSGHLIVTPEDRANREASGPGSFSTIDIVAALPRGVRIALIRSQQDKFRVHDSAFVAAGGERLRRYFVPFAGHSMRDLTLAGLQIDRGLSFVMAGRGIEATSTP